MTMNHMRESLKAWAEENAVTVTCDLSRAWNRAYYEGANQDASNTNAALRLIADIRAAIGDPHGQLMQADLIERCRMLASSHDALVAELEQRRKQVVDDSSVPAGNLVEMGHITTADPDGKTTPVAFAVVVQFPDGETCRQAIKQGSCRFSEMFGAPHPEAETVQLAE